jgi:hypothetical protein
MPFNNHFRHQTYSADVPGAHYVLMDADFPFQTGTDQYSQEMTRVSNALADHVDAVYLIHGTFAGNDALGWTAQIEKFWPKVADHLRVFGKKLFDVLADDTGNFTEEYAAELAEVLNSPNQADDISVAKPTPNVRRFNWSGENNHVGRGVAAIELLDELLTRQESSSEKRILMLCHSHAGNLVAIVTNLIGAERSERVRFLEILKPIFRSGEEQQQLSRVADALEDETRRRSLQLDIVTLGLPIRYGWDTGGYRNLLHFVNHVPRPDEPVFLSPVPKINSMDLLKMDGDFVQQFGIAGTNVFPYLMDLRLMVAEYKLGKLLQPFGRTDFWEHIKIGMRVADEGTTLLVDYDDTDGLAHRLAGHGVYTERQWLPFHLRETVKRFYGI